MPAMCLARLRVRSSAKKAVRAKALAAFEVIMLSTIYSSIKILINLSIYAILSLVKR